ncbi:hypothetical protein Mal15_22330 [Stieleria maiorica]|uniref:Uncharacterized protein n=2 Tax=Stieleria maiorica TaxID=2795974 RepID=A0A5B9MF15_9BACT|nr:hypothetical protein Mal15_22330 [Stieleria maiorica]
MRPGSAERIEHYRKLADQGEPLFAPYDENPIPMLPGEDNALRRIQTMEASNLDRAIDVLTDPDSMKRIDEQIEQLEAKSAKLKKLRKVLGGGGSAKVNFKIDEAIEKRVVAYIKRNGPSLPGEIAKYIKQAPINIGRLVSASELLAKQGQNVVLVESDQ